MYAFGFEWNEKDAKDMVRAIVTGIVTALVIAYVLRRGLKAKV